jgi:hypothetical protein
MKKLIAVVVCLCVSAAAYAYHDHVSERFSCEEVMQLANAAMTARQSGVNKYLILTKIDEVAAGREKLIEKAYALTESAFKHPIHDKRADKINAAFDFALEVGRQCDRN